MVRLILFDLVDINEFSVYELHAMLHEIEYKKQFQHPIIFRVPNLDLDIGLKALQDDANVLHLLKYFLVCKIFDTCTEHKSAFETKGPFT